MNAALNLTTCSIEMECVSVKLGIYNNITVGKNMRSKDFLLPKFDDFRVLYPKTKSGSLLRSHHCLSVHHQAVSHEP